MTYRNYLKKCGIDLGYAIPVLNESLKAIFAGLFSIFWVITVPIWFCPVMFIRWVVKGRFEE
jgi:hypothetical protein